MLHVYGVSGGYNDKPIIKNVSFEVEKGEIFGVIGPNGSGKTTLLKMLTGTVPMTKGEISLHEKPIESYSTKEKAKIIAVLPQDTTTSFSYTVEEVVRLGRYPYQKGLFQMTTKVDDQIVVESLKQTDVYQFKDKTLLSLSGGERQRVMLARALAQQPDLLLLDEPTNHLDISHQLHLLDTLKKWTEEKGLTVIAILHDLNIAALYCNRVMLLDSGEVSTIDRPYQALNEQRLKDIYNTSLRRNEHPTIPTPLITLLPNQMRASSPFRELDMVCTDEWIKIESKTAFKTLASSVIGSGFGWKKTFVNRHVNKNYNCDDAEKEFISFLEQRGINHEETNGMMTAAILDDVCVEKVEDEDVSLLVVVTAGLSNAVDVTAGVARNNLSVGTINTWVLVEGEFTEAAFVQALVVATEAKTRALHDENVLDGTTNTVATGTSTDSIVIASTQTKTSYKYAGSITTIGSAIGRSVYATTVKAIRKNKERRSTL
ncbi:heme ABC transporter ATP-binding protein [Alkalihalobacterium bogoriense]|uniref:heme ABC transporter ATP-binding protein n=1 Tax=Alkalihalobacterium bogoriense TaxID=246272 RepID=UPI000478F5E7|nr:heme ABC transporter ATP-binding protein [Alkalihalobacterium bogoriense]